MHSLNFWISDFCFCCLCSFCIIGARVFVPCLQIISPATLPHPLYGNHTPLLFDYTHTHTHTQYLLPFVSFHYLGFSLFVTTVVFAFNFVVRFAFYHFTKSSFVFLFLYWCLCMYVCVVLVIFFWFFFSLFSWLLRRGPWENFDRDWKSLIVLLLAYIVSAFMI